MRPHLLIAVLALGSLSIAARAESVTYTVSDTASGSIGAQTFTNQVITVTFVGDTTNISGNPGFYTNTPGVATINISGLGTFTFTGSTEFFDNQGEEAAGIADTSVGSILDTYNSAFATYTGSTSIGPLSGSVFYSSAYDFNTSGGILNLSSARSTSTLTAIVGAAPTPEPSSFALLGSTLLGAAGLFRRRKA